MKKTLSILLALALTLCAAASLAEGEKPFAGQTLTVSNFSFNAELLQKNIYDPFMAATGCTLVIDVGNNATRVTKLTETPEAYDVVIIGDAFVSQLMGSGLIEKIDAAKLTNLDALYDCAKAPLGADYGPAYTFNRLGIVYDADTCPIAITSFADLWSAELEGAIAIPDITTTSGPLFFYATAKAFGLEVGKDDAAIFAKLAELKKNVVNTYTSANNTITMLNQGEVSAAVLLDYSYTSAKSANPAYVWVDPAEGSFSGFNTLNIVKGCENVDLATAFIDFYISYDVQLAEALDGVDSPVRTDVVVPAEKAANFTYGAETINGLILPSWDTINASKAAWIDQWNATFSVK